MASRTIVPQHATGEPAGLAVKQQKKTNGAVDRAKNRRALGDIGNVVPSKGAAVQGKMPQQVSRPVTRSFRAQLLVNAQTTAVENNKKQASVKVDGGKVLPEAKRGLAAKPVQKKVPATKPKVTEVVEVSKKNKEEGIKKEKAERDRRREKIGSSKKTVRTLTSQLTARSKAACGITIRPKEVIADIDAKDVDNELAVVEYIEDLYKFYKLVENESRPSDYMASQPAINTQMRAILVDWLIEVHYKFELMPETLYLTISIIDRFLSLKVVPKRELQLLGVGALLIASKYEEIWAPEVNDLIIITDSAFTREQILIMEKSILGELEWTLTFPTTYVFLVRFIKASLPEKESHMDNLVYFLAELGIMNYATIMYSPSTIAASAVYAARCTLNKTPAWNDTLKLHTGFSKPEIIDCAKLLVSIHAKAADVNSKLKSAYRKYSNPLRGSVATIRPAKALLPDGV